MEVIRKQEDEITAEKPQGNQPFSGSAEPIQQRAVKMQSSQEKRKEVQNPGDGQEIIQLRASDQQAGHRHQNHVSGDFQDHR